MKKCWWCHAPKTYSFGLCYACYRWFYRHPYLHTSDYCSLCDKFISKRNKSGLCKECAVILKATGHVPKRLENLDIKFAEIKPHLVQYNSKEEALTALTPLFKSKQIKYLEALLERIYDHVTLQTIADHWGTSREYVRQCENSALQTLKEIFLN